MKQRVLALVLALVMALSFLPTAVLASIEDYPIPDYGPQAQGVAAQKFIDGRVMSVAHRAAWRHGPENSLLAIAAAIEIGVDVVELDVALTKDNVLVLSHDATINRCVAGQTGKVSDYTWEELSRTKLEPGTGGSDKPYTLTESDVEVLNGISGYVKHSGGPAVVGGTLPITRMDDAVELLNHRAMINLDKCTQEDVFVASYILFRETDMLDHVFFKNSVSASTLASWCKTAADAWNEKHPEEPLTKEDVQKSFIYVFVLSSSGTSALQGHLAAGNPLKMVEFVISNNSLDETFKEVDEVWCRENNIAMFVNTMWSGLASTRPDSETCWAEMIDRGYTAIQTDRPSELVSYLTETFLTDRASTGTIEAEHFTTFSYEDEFALSVPLGADANLNKTVSGIQNGEWLSYDNVVFDGNETLVNVFGHGLNDVAYLTVYLDEMTGENLIAETELPKSSFDQTYTMALKQTVAPGKHAVIVKVSGTPGTGLASIDSFSFDGSSSMVGEPVVEPLVVTTQPGVAPTLPATVNVSYENAAYEFNVEWENVPVASYAKEGMFPVLGYVEAIKDYITATVVVTVVESGVTEDGLVLWLDAADITDGTIKTWPAKDGYGNDATLRSGNFTLKDVGSGKGLYFNGSSALNVAMDDNFWNGKSDFTVIIYNAPEMTTSGSTNSTASQYNSALYFGKSGSSGGAYFTPSQNEIIWHFGSGTNGDYGTTYVRPTNIGSSYSGTAVRKSGTNDTVFVDGVQVYNGRTVSSSTANIASEGYIGVGRNANYYQGTICEILVYDRALTDNEIVAAQKYLTEKYSDPIVSYEEVAITCNAGETPMLPETVKVNLESGTVVEIGVTWESVDPKLCVIANTFEVKGNLSNGASIVAKVTVIGPGGMGFEALKEDMLVWFSATDLKGEGNDLVSEWKEASGNAANPAVQTNEENQPSLVVNDNGTVVGVYFDGTDKMTFSMDDKELLNGLSGATAIVYSKPDMKAPTGISTNHNSSVISFGEFGTGWGGVYVGTYTDGATGRFGTGTSGYRGILYRGGNYSDYTTTVMTKNGGENEELIINGQTIADLNTSDGSGSGATANNDAANGMLGQGKNNYYWQGTVSEVMIFDHALSEEELQLVYEYLEDTYKEKDTTVTEEGLLVWLDGSDGLVQKDGNVTGWTNKVSASQVATVKGSAAPKYKANAVNEKAGVEFNGSTALQLTLESGALNSLDGVTIIAYTNTRTPFMTDQETSQGAAWRAQRRTLLYAGEKGGSWGSVYMGVYNDYLSARIGTGTSNDNGYYKSRVTSVNGFTSTATVWDGTNQTYTMLVDGQVAGTGTSRGAVSKNNSNVLYIGEGKDSGQYGGWNGTLTELFIYDRALSDSELQNIINYLDEKYVSKGVPTFVSGVYLKEENSQVKLSVGDEYSLYACTVPSIANNPKLLWESSDPDVVSVDQDGKLTAHSIGFASVTVTTEEGGFSTRCNVRVVKTDSESLWENIQNLVAWAERRDGDSYDGWDAMEEALAALEGLSAESPADVLGEAYGALREAKLGLTPKGHVHTFGEPDIIIEASYGKTGLELITCTVCGKTESREIPMLDKIPLPFTDVPEGTWYYEAVEYAFGHELFNGVSETLFAPGRAMNRAMLVSVLYRMEGSPIANGTNQFKDVAAGRYYAEAVLWASSNGIVLGTSADQFSPDRDITRDQMAAILYRYAQYKGFDTTKTADLSVFSDSGDTSAYAKNALSWAYSEGLITGIKAGEQTLLKPKGSATRAQVATILMRYQNTVAQ